MSPSPEKGESPRWGRYGELRPKAIEAILDSCPVALVPWGALEWHSLHAPIGLDSVKAQGICEALAARCGGVVLPAIPMGVNTIKPFKGFPHCIDFPATVASRVAEVICRQLVDEGFRIIILFTGHYPPEQIEALANGARAAAVDHLEAAIEVWSDLDFLGSDFKADHAGATETSFQMHFAPGSVDLSALPDRELSLDEDGLTGEDPRRASGERGRQQLECVLERASARMEALIRKMDIRA
mgnify:CR=1 FL=1